MNWLKKILGTRDLSKPLVAPPIPEVFKPQEAKRITTESVSTWCDRLEREGNRTGNRQLLRQAANIRARLAP